MLPLDDPHWRELSHAYGPADDIPDLLRALARGDESDRDDLFWSALCHQGTVYTATYAAVPHIVAIGATRPRAGQLWYWILVGAVASSRDAAPVPADLQPAYDEAVARAETLAIACFEPGLDSEHAAWLAIAVAGLRRQHVVTNALEGLAREEVQGECPACETPVGFSVVDPFREEAANDGDPRPELVDLAALARRAGHEQLATTILELDRTVTCPACDAPFNLVDGLGGER